MNEELDHIQPDSIVGPYRIVRRFKRRGGMAGIFEVEVREKYRQPGLPRRLALKVAREEYQDALVAEADFLRRFDHPNVVRIFPSLVTTVRSTPPASASPSAGAGTTRWSFSVGSLSTTA